MKKLLLPLLFILLVSMLAAVESDPSEVVGYVKYDCIAGLNLVALPMNQGYTWVSEMGDAYSGFMDAINYWDGATQTWVGAYDLGGFWDGDFEISSGYVLMVSAIADFDIYSIGALPDTDASYAVATGLNTMMVPLNRADITRASMIGDEMGILDAINFWDATTQTWVGAYDLGGFWDGDFEVSIGYPVMVSAFDSGTWPVRAMPVLRSSINK
jgi:hypothetical protein